MPDEKINPLFPSNSHKAREGQVAPQKEVTKKVEPVAKGKVVKRKKSFFETFVGEDFPTVTQYIVNDILIPAAKNTISEIAFNVTNMIQSSIEGMLFPGLDRREVRRRDEGRGSRFRYDKQFDSARDQRSIRDRREMTERNRARHEFDSIRFDTRAEADRVLDQLSDRIFEYGQATVADFYDLSDVTSDYPDRNYGWRDLRSATTARAREGGFYLVLPRPIWLEGN